MGKRYYYEYKCCEKVCFFLSSFFFLSFHVLFLFFFPHPHLPHPLLFIRETQFMMASEIQRTKINSHQISFTPCKTWLGYQKTEKVSKPWGEEAGRGFYSCFFFFFPFPFPFLFPFLFFFVLFSFSFLIRCVDSGNRLCMIQEIFVLIRQ